MPLVMAMQFQILEDVQFLKVKLPKISCRSDV